MNKQKFMKWALPALLMSGVLFETMPGSVGHFSKDLVTIPEGAVWNFFAPPVEGLVGSCLMLALSLKKKAAATETESSRKRL